MTAVIDRLYRDYLTESDKVARTDDRANVLRLEREICAVLERSQGFAVVGNLHFSLSVCLIGKEKLQYFRVSVVTTERRVSDAGYSFARRRTDIEPVIPEAAIQRPSLRRRHAA